MLSRLLQHITSSNYVSRIREIDSVGAHWRGRKPRVESSRDDDIIEDGNGNAELKEL